MRETVKRDKTDAAASAADDDAQPALTVLSLGCLVFRIDATIPAKVPNRPPPPPSAAFVPARSQQGPIGAEGSVHQEHECLRLGAAEMQSVIVCIRSAVFNSS
jgi:hypothetical protein